MSLRRVAIALAACAAFVLSGAEKPAWAGSKLNVVVLDFKGQKKLAQKCEKAVKKVVRKKHALIPLKTYERALKRLRIKRGRNSDFARIASAIGADAIVGAKVVKKRKRRTLQVKVREGSSGKVVETIYIPLRARKVTGKVRKRMRREIFEVLAWVEPLAKPVEAEEEDEDELDEDAIFDDDDEYDEPVRRRKAKRKKRSRRRVAVEQVDDDEDFDDEPAVKKSSKRKSKDEDDDESPLLRKKDSDKSWEGSANLGISVIGRDLRFTVQPSIPQEQLPMSYQGTPVGAAHFDGELYPFLKKKGAMRNLGFSVSVDRAIRLRSRVATQGRAQEFETEQAHYGVGLLYRVPLGKASFQLAAGYDQLSHTIDTGGVDLALPNVAYSCLAAGGGLRIPISEGKMALGAAGRYLHVLDAGEITMPAAYGNATVQGVDVDAHLAYMASERMVIRGGVQFVRMGFAFDGTGAMTQLDASPDQDVGGAADTWLGGYLTAGLSF
jgi:hypothetical protein